MLETGWGTENRSSSLRVPNPSKSSEASNEAYLSQSSGLPSPVSYLGLAPVHAKTSSCSFHTSYLMEGYEYVKFVFLGYEFVIHPRAITEITVGKSHICMDEKTCKQVYPLWARNSI